MHIGIAKTKKIVIFDSDGTISPFPAQAASFIEKYPAKFAEAFELDAAVAAARLEEAGQKVLADPEHHGMRDTLGRVVAPGTADPYVFHRTKAGIVLDEFGLVTKAEEREHALHDLHKACYSNTLVLQPGSRELIQESFTDPDLAVHVVTGSDTKQVTQKLEAQLTPGTYLRKNLVFGNARKHVLTDESSQQVPGNYFRSMCRNVPEWIMVRGLNSREVFLRRGSYYMLLRQIMAQYPDRFYDDMIVVGDILEFDGMLPLMLGMHFVLVVGPTTRPWEIGYVKAHPNGHVVKSLQEALTLLNTWR